MSRFRTMEAKERRYFGESTMGAEGGKEVEVWTRKKILTIAFLCRMLMVFYGRIHDYLFEVQYSDIDYKVFSDAAEHLYYGRSPYERTTYRYTPLLALLLMPVVKWPDFGKILFCGLDVAIGFLYFELWNNERITCAAAYHVKNDESRLKKIVVIFWLANPLTAVISSRGNADVLVCAAVLCTSYLLSRNQWWLAALVHGLFAVHLKLYPIIYLPSIYLSLSNFYSATSFVDLGKRLLLNVKGYAFVLISCGSFVVSVAVCYALYGAPYLSEALFYHLYRIDTRHNFSPYFYPLYLAAFEPERTRFIGLCAFVPQCILILWLALMYSDDLPFCWLLTTIGFVSFNKVCTSQYFIWYISLLPIALRTVEMPTRTAVSLVALWFTGQGLWLLPAYLFEFKGYNTFLFMWFASLLFLVINVAVMIQLIRHHVSAQQDLVAKKKL